MKKSLFIIFALFTLISCSSPEPQPLAGGIYTAEFDARGEAALKFALGEMGLSGEEYQVSLYKRQIVKGVNHFFVVRVGEKSYELKVYEDLSGSFILSSEKEI